MFNMDRRTFLQWMGMSAATLIAGEKLFADETVTPADPSAAAAWEKLVPADKRLDPAWIKSLFDRGEPQAYTKDQFKYIGMPIGGLCAGQLYLGGDGRLWLWDIFNGLHNTAGEHYAHPQETKSEIDQGFSLQIGEKAFKLDAAGFSDVTFRGEYPIGVVTFKDTNCPVTVQLEAFSPFCPLDADFSSLPAVEMRWTFNNLTANAVDLTVNGWLEHAFAKSIVASTGAKARVQSAGHLSGLSFDIGSPLYAASHPPGSVIVFADFEGETFGDWKVEGDAFGPGPTAGAPDPEQQLSGFEGKRLANSWAKKSDRPTGKLTSPEFVINRAFIRFLIGGGNHPNETCINLIVDGQVRLTATGKNSDQMEWVSWPVGNLAGKKARLEIVDNHSGDWGHIEIDQIEFADEPVAEAKLDQQPGYGSMCFAVLNAGLQVRTGVQGPATLMTPGGPVDPQGPLGRLSTRIQIESHSSQTVSFAITWHFPNLNFATTRWDPKHAVSSKDVIEKGRYYATKFDSAVAVAKHLADNHEAFYQQTKLWRDTWYDSALPYWFLDRTIANISTLATNTAYRFANGRFWGYEGVGSCRGTCTHVYGYEQSIGRLFPELDFALRKVTDYGVAFHDNGMIGYRGEKSEEAVDGQCMLILRTLRDHQMSSDKTFLVELWPKIKKAVQWLIDRDTNNDGILTGAQANTLDAKWYGAVPWITGLYLAALRAAIEMATVTGDADFVGECKTHLEAGQKNFVPRMFNGEYFAQVPDEKHLDKVGSYDGCEIDQVLGQSWAFQVGLGRVLPEKETRSALAALWKYNFAKDVGPFRNEFKPGRWFAMPGETGTLMCSWPRGESRRIKTGFDYYFNECMNGFEHQLAGHMIWEGMVQEGLAVERAIHDRYHASKRNPWNEIECGDHYARSMASFGVYLAACGFEYDGPAGRLAFAPKWSSGNFKCAFITSEGWGTFSQVFDGTSMKASIVVKHGRLKLSSLVLVQPEKMHAKSVAVRLDGTGVRASLKLKDRLEIDTELMINRDQMAEIVLS